MTDQIPIDAIDPVSERKPRAKRGNGHALAKVEEAPASVTQADTFTVLFERLARDPTVDPARIREFLMMKREEEDRHAQRAYNAAMAAAQAELIPVARNQSNEQTHSKYADLAAIAEAALPIIHKHGFGLQFSEFQSPKQDHMGVACKVSHASGFSERHEFHIPMDGAGLRGNANKTATHTYGSTFSYGRRYATCGVFNIATKDDDDGNKAGGKSVETITEEQSKTILDRIAETEAELGSFLRYMKANAVEAIPAKDFGKAMSALDYHNANRRGAKK